MPTATLSRKGIGGPKSPEGKRRVSLNALKHGLHAESPQAQDKIAEEIGVSFMQVLEDVCTQCQPMDTIEMAMVRRIARSIYRLRITEAMEDNLLQRRGVQSRPSEYHERILLLERRIDLQLHRAIAALATKRIREQKNRQNKLPSPYVPAMDTTPITRPATPQTRGDYAWEGSLPRRIVPACDHEAPFARGSDPGESGGVGGVGLGLPAAADGSVVLDVRDG